jgi:hypothetical protein
MKVWLPLRWEFYKEENNVILSERQRTKNPKEIEPIGSISLETLRYAQGDMS